jgi:cation diffusion facilitator CzcD-associated flavoprotein CzcO
MARPRVCVIGGGASGLTTIKQLKDQGITDIECFEKEDEVGGIFLHGAKKERRL